MYGNSSTAISCWFEAAAPFSSSARHWIEYVAATLSRWFQTAIVVLAFAATAGVLKLVVSAVETGKPCVPAATTELTARAAGSNRRPNMLHGVPQSAL